MKVTRKRDGAELHAVQWQPGVEHPAVTREYPPTRGDPGGGAEVGDAIACPGDWLVSESPDAQRALVVSQGDFEDEYDVSDATATHFCPMAGLGVACGGDRCAWWHGASERCAAHVLADALQAMCEGGGNP